MRGKKKLGNHANILRELRENPELAGFVAFDEFAQTIVLRRPIPDVSNLACPISAISSRGPGATTTPCAVRLPQHAGLQEGADRASSAT